LAFAFLFSCDRDVTQKGRLRQQDLNDSRSTLTKEVLDSTQQAEQNVAKLKSADGPAPELRLELAGYGSINYAFHAYVTAESTYPGYSVDNINDGSRTTTVGPSYSWANNFPAGVSFLKVYS
jgi:hypothetical protein